MNHTGASTIQGAAARWDDNLVKLFLKGMFDFPRGNADGYFVDAIKYNSRKSKSAFFGAREHVKIVRDLDALLNSLVNIERDSLVADSIFRGRGRRTTGEFYSHAHQHAAPKTTASGRARRADQPDFAFFPA